jgi:hypothetical protein
MLVEEQNGTQGLILGGGGDVVVNGKIRQELPNLFNTHVL